MTKNIKVEKRRCNPELLEQYPNICHEGIRSLEYTMLDEYSATFTGHFHYVADSETFIAGEM